MADFFQLLKTRRSVRDFQEKEVPLELIQDIIRDACMAPSSGNGQPWKFIIVNNKEWMRKLSDESKRNMVSFMEKDPHSPLKKYESNLRNKDFNVFYNAPCLVYIVGSKEVRSLLVDCTLAACYFMFSAADRGLGTCWVQLGAEIRNPEIRKAIGLPENYMIGVPIILGYPQGPPGSPMRNQPEILKIIS
ncbi:MAG TPA: nitroreductase family protein [Thermodesulfobacteriota bacterium]|nr:nitroreductase family protein [Thermodesulfobacteriota bacterium]